MVLTEDEIRLVFRKCLDDIDDEKRNENAAKERSIWFSGDEEVKEKTLFKQALASVKKRKRLYYQKNKNRKPSVYSHPFQFDPSLWPRVSPSLTDLTLESLAMNCEFLQSLELVPPHLTKPLSALVTYYENFDTNFLRLLIQVSREEIYVGNCNDLKANDLIDIFSGIDKLHLKVLRMDSSGSGITDRFMRSFVNGSSLPFLSDLSLQNAYRLTDEGLSLILRSAPLLCIVNLCECRLLTSHSLEILSDKFEFTLTKLNISACHSMRSDKRFRQSLNKFKKLKCLSVSLLRDINFTVMSFMTLRGSTLTGLYLSRCEWVSAEFIWTIGHHCQNLESMDLSGLDYLGDSALEFLARGCRRLTSLDLTQTSFSDQSISAFLEVSGASFNRLSLRCMQNVGPNCAISVANVCKNLEYLDLSGCPKLKKEDIRRIVLHCLNLKKVNVRGCEQVESGFIKESKIFIDWLKLSPFDSSEKATDWRN